jgi:hypothetical protein
MHEAQARIEAEAEEPDLSRCRLERHRVVLVVAMVKAASSRCVEWVAPPTAQLFSGQVLDVAY